MERNSLKKILEKQPYGAIERYKLQKDLSDRYGSDGVKIYLLVDGNKTAEEIMKRAGLSEERFIEIVTYMERNFLLKSEEPLAQQPAAPEGIPPVPLIKTEESADRGEKESALGALITKQKPLPEKTAEVKPEKQKPVPPVAEPQLLEPPKSTHVPKTPLEKKLYEKFGDAGLSAYSLIDEFKTPRDILQQTKMSEEELIKILEFMNNEGIIKLEKPHEAMEKPIIKAPPVPAAPQLQQKPAAVEAPPQKPVEKPLPKPSPPVTFNRDDLYKPIVGGLNLLTRLRIEAELLKRYGNDGVKTFSLMNGKRTNVKIIKDTRINPVKFDDLVSFLLEKGVVKLQPLTNDNIKELYGEEGSVIYGKYKRDGILLYELIDKKASLKDIVRASGIEPKLAVEIFSFIHKVLGLDIPIDTELLYRQLGVKT
jgi:hypothetical protein